MNRQQYISLLSLLICFLGIVGIVYFYRELVNTKNRLETANKELKKSKITIAARDSLIEVQDSLRVDLERKNQKLEEALLALDLPVADQVAQGRSKEEIVNELKTYAVKEKEKAEAGNTERKRMVKQLFTPGAAGEEGRKKAQQILLKKYGKDSKLTGELLDNIEKTLGDKQYNKSVWQALYILSKMDRAYLKSEQARMKILFEKIREEGLAKPKGSTDKDIRTIIRKLG